MTCQYESIGANLHRGTPVRTNGANTGDGMHAKVSRAKTREVVVAKVNCLVDWVAGELDVERVKRDRCSPGISNL